MKSTDKNESYAAAVADGEKRGLKLGIGEIIDFGQMSKAEVALAYPIVLDSEMEAAIDMEIKENDDLKDLFGDLQTLSRDEARARIIERNSRYQAYIDAAPEAHIYDYRYCA